MSGHNKNQAGENDFSVKNKGLMIQTDNLSQKQYKSVYPSRADRKIPSGIEQKGYFLLFQF
jgi:hypothetical protein